MFKPIAAFNGFSVDDTEKAKTFYSETLGLKVADEGGMGLSIELPGGCTIFAYPKEDHQPAAYTMLNFEVEDIDAAVDALAEHGVQFERYENFPHDEKGIVRGRSQNMGPDIAWFTDPAGNILSVLQS